MGLCCFDLSFTISGSDKKAEVKVSVLLFLVVEIDSSDRICHIYQPGGEVSEYR